MTHEEQADNIAAYALGALPELEVRLLERHLAGCEACHEELQRAQQGVDALARSVPCVEPPPALKESLMAVVTAEAAGASEPSAAARRTRPSRINWLPRLRPAAAFAAAALAIALAFAAGTLTSGDADPRVVAAEVDHARLPDGTASLVIPDEARDGAVLRVEGLPDPGRARVYQVWIERDDEVIPVSIFSVDSSGSGAAGISESLEDVSAVMVTRESRGGATAPTEPPAIVADV